MKLTPEQRAAMGLSEETVKVERGWTTDQIKEAITSKGFTLAGFAREVGKTPGDVYQSLNKRSPKMDKMIAILIGVHESVIWPNRYFVNGVSIDKKYKIDEQSDETLQKLNDAILNPPPITTVVSWVDGPNGGPLIRTHNQKKPPPVVDCVSFDEEIPARDVSPLANERPKPFTVTEAQEFIDHHVTLPVGMKLDGA